MGWLMRLRGQPAAERFKLGSEPVILPEPLDTLALHLAATRRGHAAIGDQSTSAWLFPGGQPGRPISAARMTERLRDLGIHSSQAPSAALFQLATDLPAAALARMLGIHITVAVAWQRAFAGDWAAYAAEVSQPRPRKAPITPQLDRHSGRTRGRRHPRGRERNDRCRGLVVAPG